MKIKVWCNVSGIRCERVVDIPEEILSEAQDLKERDEIYIEGAGEAMWEMAKRFIEWGWEKVR